MHNLQSITTEKRSLPPRIILLGTPKVGKTTWASNATDAVLLPIVGEEGADDVSCAKFPTANTYQDVVDALTSLAEGQHNYRFVVIDSTTALERVVWAHTCKLEKWAHIESPGYGKGYAIALQHWNYITTALDFLRNHKKMGCILIGHTKVRIFNDPQFDPYDTFTWDVNQNAASLMTKWADCVMFARQKQFVKQVGDDKKKDYHAVGSGERCLYTQERPAHPGGGRGVYGRLPYELPLDFDAWLEAVVTASSIDDNQQELPMANDAAATDGGTKKE
jgi:hypothetical protein